VRIGVEFREICLKQDFRSFLGTWKSLLSGKSRVHHVVCFVETSEVISARQEFGFSRFQPLFLRHVLTLRAMAVAERIVRASQISARTALFHMAAKEMRSAHGQATDDLALFFGNTVRANNSRQ